MISSLYVELRLLNNFGILDEENSKKDEIVEYRKEFVKQMTVEKYLGFFNRLEQCLFDEAILNEDKIAIIELIIGFIKKYDTIERNVDKLPITIQNLYYSSNEFLFISLILEQLKLSMNVDPNLINKVLIKFLVFLENFQNEIFIYNFYCKIEILYNEIMKQIYKVVNNDFYQINLDLIELLKTKMTSLEKNKGLI